MSIFEDTNPRALKELLADIHSSVMALPDFQRDFVWDPSATQELVVSIAYNYPAGSLLRVRDTKRVFAAREFEGAPSLDGKRHTFLVLDGQQRLTSLYQAFYGVGEHRYYLNVKSLLDGKDFDEAIFNLRATTRQASLLEEFSRQAEQLILPLRVLKGGAGKFGQWTRNVARLLPDTERLTLEDALDAIEERWIMTVDDYRFPVVTLSDKTEPDALCTIFETLNRTGVKLSVFELLTARFWPQNINLRSLWDVAKENHPIIGEFEVDPYYVLQAIALASRKAPSCKRSDVLNLEPEDIREWWQPVVNGLEAGLSILRDDCKVVTQKWLPYQTMLVPLSAVLAKTGLTKSPKAGAQREYLKRWFWCCVFGQAYENAPNSQAAKDVGELLNWFDGGQPPETVVGLRFDPKTLCDVTPRQRSVYRGVICLILGSGTGARDFHTQAVITANLMNENGIDDHHVFPDDYLLKKKDIKLSRLRDCILNRTLIDRTTNQMISNNPPSVYLTEIKKTAGFPLNDVLASHCLPAGDASPLWSDDYEVFLSWRQDRLWAEIQKATGLAKADDLESGT